ncbi:MAG: hypothetical protein MJ239_03315 [Bacilli bacterium]|nr:hypothetical protein [Bacilli bacterium]
MNKKSFLLLTLLPLLCACGNGGEYTYVNPEEPQKDLRPSVEEGMVMDGLDNESIYSTADTKSFFAGENKEVKADVKVAFADKGLLVHAKVTKNSKEFFENIDLDIFKQDSFELYINPSNFQDELNAGCLQFRLSPLSRRETWIGQQDVSTKYSWTKYYKPFNYGTYVDGDLNTQKGQPIKNANYVGYEYYIPYSTMGLDYNPKGLAILPALVNATSVITGAYKWYSYDNVTITDITKFPVFGSKVFRDQTGNVINTDYTDVGYDLSHQKDADPYVVQDGWNDMYARLNLPSSSNFDVKVNVELVKALKNDKYPKVGLALRNEKGKIGFLLDPRQGKNNYQALVVEREAGAGSWDWDNAPIFYKGEPDYERPISMEIIRKGDKIYYLLNNQLGYVGNADVLDNGLCDAYLLTMNYYAIYKGFEMTTSEESINQKIAEIEKYDFSDSTPGIELKFDGTIEQCGPHDQWLKLSNKATNYEFSVDVLMKDVLLKDQYPKIGIAEQDESTLNCFFIDPHKNHDTYNVASCTGSTNPDARNWSWLPSKAAYFSMKDWVNLQIVRSGDTSTYYIDNQEVYSIENKFEGDSQVMLFTMNHTATYKNISFKVN